MCAKVACSGPLEPANSARRDHPRTVPPAKMSSKGRTELKISLSRAKNVKEAAGDVRFCVCPQKTSKNVKKRIFSHKISEIFRTCPNASERIRMHPNLSECIRAHPNRSEQVRKPRKTCENVEKLRENIEKLREDEIDRVRGGDIVTTLSLCT